MKKSELRKIIREVIKEQKQSLQYTEREFKEIIQNSNLPDDIKSIIFESWAVLYWLSGRLPDPPPPDDPPTGGEI